MKSIPSLVLMLVALAGCEGGTREANATPVDSLTLRPGYAVDSILPMDEMLRRFRAGLGPEPERLADGAASREALVRRFVNALAANDSAALTRMHLTRAEFAWLYFPTSRFARPPYELPPDILWLRMRSDSNKGIARALRLFESGGTYVGHACDADSGQEGENTLWTGCIVRWRGANGSTESFRLFGSIIERHARFKFVSYANPL